jgi:myo-inositol 2-dehydrogenase/D-chiro-inositol 1-dehydrogenase
MRRVKLGIIGVGEIGTVHATNIVRDVPGAELAAVADLRLDKARECARSLGVARFYGRTEELLSDREIEAVLICTTPESHSRIMIEAASAGKHIFCEKPLGLDPAEAEKALAQVKAAGVRLQVGFNRRFDASFRRLKEHVRLGKLGTLHSVHIISRDPEPPGKEYYLLSGGILLDMTIHDFDLARHLIGDEVVEVYATGSTLIAPWLAEHGDADTIAAILKFSNGAVGIISNSCKAVFGYDQRVEVFGERGMMSVTNPLPDLTTVVNEEGHRTPPLLHFFTERYRASYAEEIRSFVESVADGKEPAVTGRDGLIGIQIATAARQSMRTGLPVKLSAIG